jgi:hypothetical protein
LHGTGKFIFNKHPDFKEFFGEFNDNQMVHGELIYKNGNKHITQFMKGKIGLIKENKED